MDTTLKAMAKSAPKISVIMSVYNGGDYLREAVDSILGQTFKDFEFIIINDGSTDKTPEILKSYTDPRITVLNQENQGLVASLNRGLAAAQGEFIARQDADDQSIPTRFEKQYKFLSTHPKVVMAGSSMRVMNEQSKITHSHHVLLNDPELKQELLLRSPFAHGSVMIRHSALKKTKGYDHAFWPAEDYELWLRLSAYGEFANFDECLYVYRENSGGISASNQAKQAAAVERVQQKAWQIRNQLVTRQGIRLSVYRKLPQDSEFRVARILANIQEVSQQAKVRHDQAFALKNLSLVARSPLAYRHAAGTIKRRLKKS